MSYWQSTKSPVHMFSRAYESPELAMHIKECGGVDPAIISANLKVGHFNPWAVAAYQRRLGVRPITGGKKR